MPKRPSSSHQLGDKAHAYVRLAFLEEGWVVSDIHPDYGEDLLVRIFNKEYSRPLYFFVQSKGCKDVSDFLVKNEKFISYPLKRTHIEEWKHFLEPVIITIWDEKTKVIYWQIIQEAIKEVSINKDQSERSIYVPTENILNKEGFMRIAMRTLNYSNHLEREKSITDAIMRSLEEKFGIEIEYEENCEVATIKDAEGINFILTGRIAEMMEKAARLEGFSEEDLCDDVKMQMYLCYAFENALLLAKKRYQVDQKNDCIYVSNDAGYVIHTIKPISNFLIERENVEELQRYVEEFLE